MKAENDDIYQQILLKNKSKINDRKINFKLLKMKLKNLFYQGKEIEEKTFNEINDGFMVKDFIKELPEIFIGYKKISLNPNWIESYVEKSYGTNDENKVCFIIEKHKPDIILYFHDLEPIRFYNEEYHLVTYNLFEKTEDDLTEKETNLFYEEKNENCFWFNFEGKNGYFYNLMFKKEIDEIKITIQTEYKTKNSKKKYKPKQYVFKNSVSLDNLINFFENNEILHNFIKNNHILKKWID